MSTALHLRVIGSLAVSDRDGREIAVRGRKVQAMLALLALRPGEILPRLRLGALLWGNVPEQQARESVRQALHQLGRDLGAPHRAHVERIHSRDAIRLNPDLWVIDASSVTGATGAIDDAILAKACSHTLLEGLDGISAELDHWLLAERSRFEDRVRGLLESGLKIALSANEPQQIIAGAERLASFDGTSEFAARALMSAHARLGARADALRAFERCEAALKLTLDTTPSRETLGLAATIRTASGFVPPPVARTHQRADDTSEEAAPVPSGRAVAAWSENVVSGAGPVARLAPVLGIIPLDARDGAYPDLGELIAEESIARLSTSGVMRVISRLSTSAVKARGRRVDEMGLLLGAQFIASGGYLVQGDSIRVSVELAEARTQEVVWHNRFEGRLADLTAHRSELLEEICTGVAAAMAASERRKVHRCPLPTLEDFSLLLAGSTLMHRPTLGEFKRSREVLEHLIERHPETPEPRAWLAKWHVLGVTRGYVDAKDADAVPALEQTRRALDASPDCSLALAIEGFVHCHMRRDLDAAGATLRTALAVNPNEPLAWLFASVVQVFREESEQAWDSARRAIELSPLDPMRHYYEALGSAAALAANRLPEAIRMASRALETNNTHLPTLRQLAVAQVEADEIEAARRTAKSILAIDPDFTLVEYVARAPRGGERFRMRCAKALRQAGIPES
jgi:adenylate cyclase